MIEIFDISFSIPGFLLWCIFLIGIISRIIWFVGKQNARLLYFPGYKVCMAVHQNIDKWWKTSKEMISSKPNVTVLGFFLTPIWILLIALNVVLLAQVLEVFFSGGKRIPLPYVGTYAVFPLIMGVLFATSETVLAVLYDHVKSKTARVFLVTMVGLMILAEAGLAYYRAWLINTGALQMSPTMWDTVMFRSGPFLAALIGFCVPVSETLTGKFSFQDFIEGIVGSSVRWIGGFFLWIWSAANYWMFGYHSPPPRDPTETEFASRWLIQGNRRYENIYLKFGLLKAKTQQFQNRSKSFLNFPIPVENYRNDLTSLKDGVNGFDSLKNSWREHHAEIMDGIKIAVNNKQLESSKYIIQKYKFIIKNDLKTLRLRANMLAAGIQCIPKKYRRYLKAIHFYNAPFNKLDRKRAVLSQHISFLEGLIVHGISNLPQDKIHDRKAAEDLMSNIEKIKNDLNTVGNIIQSSKIDQANNILSLESHDALVRDALLFIKNEIPSLVQEGKSFIKTIKDTYNTKRKELRYENRGSFFHRKSNDIHQYLPVNDSKIISMDYKNSLKDEAGKS